VLCVTCLVVDRCRRVLGASPRPPAGRLPQRPRLAPHRDNWQLLLTNAPSNRAAPRRMQAQLPVAAELLRRSAELRYATPSISRRMRWTVPFPRPSFLAAAMMPVPLASSADALSVRGLATVTLFAQGKAGIPEKGGTLPPCFSQQTPRGTLLLHRALTVWVNTGHYHSGGQR